MNFTDKKIETYATNLSSSPSTICSSLEKHTRSTEAMSQMLIGKLEASFFGNLIRSMRARRILEIGTFTGYSALAMAEHLPSDGELHTIDIEKRPYTEQFWKEAKQLNKIHFHQGPGLEIIPKLQGPFDIVFIDADKENYSNYFNLVESKLSPHGLVIVDNVLWSGRVLLTDDEIQNESSTKALKKFNEMIHQRPDLHKTMLPIRDGIFLINKID